MIAIKFSPKYEDRASIFFKNQENLKSNNITYNFKETPQGEYDYFCYWIFDYPHAKIVNIILKCLRDLKEIMGVDDLEFQYIYSEKEFYTQITKYEGSIPWFKV